MGGGGGVGAHGAGQVMHMDDEHDEHHGLDEASLKEHEEVTKVKVKHFFSLFLLLYRCRLWTVLTLSLGSEFAAGSKGTE